MIFEPIKKTYYRFPSVNSIADFDIGYPFFFPGMEETTQPANSYEDLKNVTSVQEVLDHAE